MKLPTYIRTDAVAPQRPYALHAGRSPYASPATSLGFLGTGTSQGGRMKSAQRPPSPAIDDSDFLEEASRLAPEGPEKQSWRERLQEYAAYRDFFRSAFVEATQMKSVFLFRA